MARPWRPRIPVYRDLFGKHQVHKISQATGLDRFAVVGRLLVIWLEAQEKAQGNGLLHNKYRQWADAVVGHDGFADAMAAAGWLEFTTTGIKIINFHKSVSKRAVRRIEEADRKSVERDCGSDYIADKADIAPPIADKVGVVGPKPPRSHRQRLSNGPPDELFERFWDAYPLKVAKVAAVAAWKKLAVTEELLARMIAAIGEQLRSDRWVKDDGQFIPHASTWLNKRRWEDQLPPAGGPVGGGPRGPVQSGARFRAGDNPYGRKRKYGEEETAEVPGPPAPNLFDP